MTEKNNATCSICGRPYYLCMSCKDTLNLSPWKIFTDTSEHYKVFQIIKGFSTGIYNKEETKEKLKNIDLRDLDTYRPHIRDLINDILKEENLEQNKKLDLFKPNNIKEINKKNYKKDNIKRSF